LHPAQDDEEQPPQPLLSDEPEDGAAEDRPMPNFESRFCVSFEPQFGHVTSGLDPKTSFSKQQLQLVH
jgi:hypothetical protein